MGRSALSELANIARRLRAVARSLMDSRSQALAMLEAGPGNPFLIYGNGEGGCDTGVTIVLSGCYGLPVADALVSAVSPADGSAMMSGLTDNNGSVDLCGLASDGGVIIEASVPGYKALAQFVPLPQLAPFPATLAPLSGFVAPPTVTFSDPPPGGTRATGYARLTAGGLVQDVVITDPGSGYADPPTVTFSADEAGYPAASGVAVLGRVESLTITNGGSGYSGGTPTATITAGGRSAAASITGGTTPGGAATATTISDGGAGYSYTPVVLASGNPSIPSRAPLLRASIGGGAVTALAIADGGDHVASALSFSGGRGTGATATPAVSGGVVSSITLANRGYGYVLPPTVAITNPGGTGSGATATAAVRADVVGGVILSRTGRTRQCVYTCGAVPFDSQMTILQPDGTTTSGGQGFQPGRVIFQNTDSGRTTQTVYDATFPVFYGGALGGNASAAATISGGQVVSISAANSPGYNYPTPPTVTISPPPSGGTRATAHATIDPTTGAVTAIVVDSPGSGYVSRPGVTISPTPYPEVEMTVSGQTLQYTLDGSIWPYADAAAGQQINRQATKRPSSITCSPYSATYDFTGTTVDGIFFQGPSKIVTISA